MDRHDEDIQHRLTKAYERSRIRLAIQDAVPAMVLAAVGLMLHLSWTNVFLGGSIVLAVICLRWMGREMARGAGLAMGLAWIPLLVPVLSLQLGYICAPDHCHSLCRASCTLAGFGLGFLLARKLAKRGHHLGAWLAAGSLMIMSSAIGCQCVGIASLAVFSCAFVLGSYTARQLLPATKPTC